MGLLDALFGKTAPERKEFSITLEDKNWVDVCFKWLIKEFGYPAKGMEPFRFNEKDFPVTHNARKINIDNLLADLCNLTGLDSTRIKYTLVPDIRDIPNTPRRISGNAFESDLEIIPSDKTYYTIHLANSIAHNELLLLRRLILELVTIKLNEKNPEYISGNMTYFGYILSIYLGFGLLISKALVDVGVEYVAGWQHTWRNKSEVPYQVIAYALASYAKLTATDNPLWKDELAPDVKNVFVNAIEYLTTHPNENTYFDPVAFENNLKARSHFDNAETMRKERKTEAALKEYEIAISLATDKQLLVLINLNAGYSCIMNEDYETAIPFYEKTLQIQPEHDYAYTNLGFVYTMLGKLSMGKEYLEKVDPFNKTLQAYLLRDWAVYYMNAGDDEQAEEYFSRAFGSKMSIDLLEYFYAKYLLSKSRKEEALEYVTQSVEKGEKQGIELQKILTKE